MTRITSPCTCGCGGIYDREDDQQQQTSVNVDTRLQPGDIATHPEHGAGLVGLTLGGRLRIQHTDEWGGLRRTRRLTDWRVAHITTTDQETR